MNYNSLEAATIKTLKYANELICNTGEMYRKSFMKVVNAYNNAVQAVEISEGVIQHINRTKDVPINSISSKGSTPRKRYEVESPSKSTDTKDEILFKILDKLDELSVCVDRKTVDKSEPCVESHTEGDTVSVNEDVHTKREDADSKDDNHGPGPHVENSISARQALAMYVDGIDALSAPGSICNSYKETEECAEILKFWVHQRFNQEYAPARGYNLKFMGNWIRAIILAYGDAARHGKSDKFIEKFRKWCEKLNRDNPYVLPKFVYKYLNTDDRSLLSRKASAITQIFSLCGKFLKLVFIRGDYKYGDIDVNSQFGRHNTDMRNCDGTFDKDYVDEMAGRRFGNFKQLFPIDRYFDSNKLPIMKERVNGLQVCC